MTKYDVAVVGEIYLDHVFSGFDKWPQPGEEVFTNEYVQELGGGAAITACSLGRLGRSVSLIGAVGENDLPWVGERLSNYSVSSSGLHGGPGRTGVTVSVSTQADRSFFTYAGENAALEDRLSCASILEKMRGARHVHFAMPISASLAAVLLEELHAAECTTSLDVGHQAKWLRDPANLVTCAKIHYLLPNECEAKILCDGDACDYLNFTLLNQWPVGVVKMGTQGAIMRGNGGTLHAPAPKVQTVDTTGAGDAFNAGFIDGLLDSESNEECLRRGCLCGGLSTRAAGALRALPTRKDLKRCYEEVYG